MAHTAAQTKASLRAPLRIGFFGPAGSGKSTQATLLRQQYKGDVLSFATPLKKAARDLFGERMEDVAFARRASQQLGMLCRNVAGPGFWVEKLVEKVSPDRNCFVDDVRFMSEYHALKRLGFILIRLSAPERTLRARRPDMGPEQWAHESETAWVTLTPDAAFESAFDPDAVHRAIVLALDELTRVPLTVG